MKNDCKLVNTKIHWIFSDRQFYHKWALLTDPDDITGGAKVGGFIEHCCTSTLKFNLLNRLPKNDINVLGLFEVRHFGHHKGKTNLRCQNSNPVYILIFSWKTWMKGDAVKIPPKSERDEDDIEA